MSDDANPYSAPTVSSPKPEHAKRSSILFRLIILSLWFLGATYLAAYPGLASPPVSQTQFLMMIPTAPIVLLCAFVLPNLGNPMVTGALLSSIMLPSILIAVIKFFHNDQAKQTFTAIGLGLLNGLTARVCFFIVHSLST